MSTIAIGIIKVGLANAGEVEAMVGGSEWHVGVVGTLIHCRLVWVTAEEAGEPREKVG